MLKILKQSLIFVRILLSLNLRYKIKLVMNLLIIIILMRGCLAVVIIGLLVIYTTILFNQNPDSRFNITDLVNPSRIVLNPIGSQLIVWNNNTSQFQIYSTAGAKTCSGNLPYPIINIIWPKRYMSMTLVYSGNKLIRIDEFYCQNMKTFNIINNTVSL